MRQTEGFTLKRIHHIPYLLPFGQRIAEQRHGIRINESGAFLWETIPKVQTKEELLSLFAKHYQAKPEDFSELKNDMDTFLNQLTLLGMIEDNPPVSETTETSFLNIGGLYLKLTAPEHAISREFSPFLTEEHPQIDMHIEITTTTGLTTSSMGKLLLHSEEIIVCERESDYLIYFPLAKQIKEVILKKDGSHAHFYCYPPYREPLITDLFHAIRFVYFYLAQTRGMLALHSASILYKGKAWLFSGSSGTGKSTHTNLWHDKFGTSILNGDLNLVAGTEDGYVIYGIPWCGTSNIANPGTYPLGGIIHLKQGDTNHCSSLSADEKALLILQRSISPAFTKKMLSSNLDFAQRLSGNVFVTRLFCTKEPDAAEYMKCQIDQYEKQK